MSAYDLLNLLNELGLTSLIYSIKNRSMNVKFYVSYDFKYFCKHVFGVVGWLVGFVALRPKSTAMVIAGRSVHLTTLFPGQA